MAGWAVQLPWDELTGWGWWPVMIAVLGQILALGFVVHVLAKGGSSASTLLWMVFVLAAPWIGLALYYAMPRRIQMRRLRRRRSELEWIEGSLEEVMPFQTRSEPGAPFCGSALGRLLCRLNEDAVHEGCAVDLLPKGEAFFSQVIDAVDRATHFIHFQTYTFRPDTAGLRLLDHLAAAARRGVEVRLLYDSFGSWGLRSGHVAPVVEAGGSVAAFLPLLWRRRPFTLNLRNHRKLVVVDGVDAWLGGRNVGDEYAKDRFGRKARKWLDAMVHVSGPAVVSLQRVFIGDWYNATGEDLAKPQYCKMPEPTGEVTVGVVDGGPDRRTHDMQWALFQMISMAQDTIDISTPYLIPPATLMTAVQVASTRGVRVRIHTNGLEAEQFVLYRAQRAQYAPLLDAGVEITETTAGDYNHAKFVVVDRRHCYAGSANWDSRSALLNFEIGVMISDVAFAEEATRLFDRRAAEGRRFTSDDLPTGLAARVIQGACRVVSPLL